MDKRKILIVDDEKGFTEMLQLNLESTGKYDVRIVNEPQNAVIAALQYQPDLILLDIIMPNMEGPDVAIELKNNPEIKDVPIVFLTATVTRQEVESQNGVIGGRIFVAKPSRLVDLLDSIDKTLNACAN